MPARRLELVRPGDLRALLAEGTRAQHEDGDLEAGRQCFERAYRLAEQAGDTESMALAALGLAGLWVREGRTVTSSVLLEARLQHVLGAARRRIPRWRSGSGPGWPARRTTLAARTPTSWPRSTEVRATGNPELLAEALRIAHHCLLGPEHVTLRRQLAVELTKAAFRTDRRSDLLMGLLWQTADAYCAGDRHAGRLLGELKEHLKPRDHLAVGFVVSAIDVMLAIRAGRFAEAEELAVVCARRGAAAGDADHDWWAAAQLVTIRWYQGRLAELLPALHERVHSPVLSTVDNSAVAALAVAAAMSGDRYQAASSLAALCGPDLAALPRSSAWLVTMHGVVEAAYLLEDDRRRGPGLRAAPPVRGPADDRQPRGHLLRVDAARPRRRHARHQAAGPGHRAPDRGRQAEPRAGALARAAGVQAAAGPGAPAARCPGRRRHRAPRA